PAITTTKPAPTRHLARHSPADQRMNQPSGSAAIWRLLVEKARSARAVTRQPLCTHHAPAVIKHAATSANCWWRIASMICGLLRVNRISAEVIVQRGHQSRRPKLNATVKPANTPKTHGAQDRTLTKSV